MISVNRELFVCKILLVIFMLTVVLTGGQISFERISENLNDKENKEIVKTFEEKERKSSGTQLWITQKRLFCQTNIIGNKACEQSLEQVVEETKDKNSSDEMEGKITKNKIELSYRGHNVVGIIEIPRINLKYPILDKTTEETMNISITKFYGGDINSYGNVALAGHNNYSGTMFGNADNLKIGDSVYLTDSTGRKLEYKIYNMFITEPDNISVVETKDKTIREVTLITCKYSSLHRLIIKAREVV